MFKKLKQKFVLITMLMVTIVVAISFTTICAVEQRKDYMEIMSILSASVENAEVKEIGQFYGGQFNTDIWQDSNREALIFDGESASEAPSNEDFLYPRDLTIIGKGNENIFSSSSANSDYGKKQEEAQAVKPPSIGGDRGKYGERAITPIAVYRVEEDGTLFEIKDKTTAAIDTHTLSQITLMLDELEEGTGTIHEVGLHYARCTVSETTYVAFADISSTSSWKSLAMILLAVGVGVILVFFILTWFLSEWALRPVKEAWSSQKQFVEDASHDLKTPLTVVLANTSILQKHPESYVGDQMQWVDNTQAAAENMLVLVNEMLELASVEEMINLNPVLEYVDLSDLVESLSLSWDALAMENGVVSDLDCRPGIIVKGDEQRISKMVSTIAENAFKYVNSGGMVKMSLDRYNKMARLRISNTGDAIAPEDLDHIFDRFYRSDKTRTSGVGGFGLGLAIARETARSHGGDIVCESSGETGTVFTITLPLVGEKG